MKDYTEGMTELGVRAELNRIKNAARHYKYTHRCSTAGRWTRIRQSLLKDSSSEMMDIMMDEMSDLVFGRNYFENSDDTLYKRGLEDGRREVVEDIRDGVKEMWEDMKEAEVDGGS